IQMPQIQAWAIAAKKGDVSRAFANEGGWVIAQVTDHRAAGARPFEAAKPEIRAALELSLRQAKPLAAGQRIFQAVRGGQTLKASLSQTLLSTRQRRYVTAWVQKTLADQKVDDKRPEVEETN